MRAQTGVRGFHELRVAYACDRYQQIRAEKRLLWVVGGRSAGREARVIIGLELEHSRAEADLHARLLEQAKIA